MKVNTDSYVNSGVQANVGMKFQKHCTLYLFLEKYEDIKEKKYFIILEHLEDIVFGYLDENGLLEKIETFQAKKSTNKWTIGKKLIEIVKKIADVSQSILDDEISKNNNFNQQNYFTTNNTIELKKTIKGKIFKEVIDETNNTVKYSDLDSNIKNKIITGTSSIEFSEINKLNLENLVFNFIDISRTPIGQLEQLYGKFKTVFGNSVEDPKASIDTLLYYFKEIEAKYNQGNIAKLTDKTKRIESDEINKILNIITTKKLAYTFWREKEKEICTVFNISLFDKSTFKLHYLNSFDEFKDLKESEHKKIYDFVLNNKNIFQNYVNESDCILAFYNEFNKKKTTTLRELQLKAVISSAFVEIINTEL